MIESTESHESRLGTTLDGRYKLESIIGEGGFGVVFKATQISTNQVVAIKVLHEELVEDSAYSDEYIKRFVREMEVIAKLKHPNLVRLFDTGTEPKGDLYMVLEFIEGKTLSEVIRKEGRLSLPETLHVMGQVLDALHAAHKLGIVHRDLKPQNIMLTSTGYRRNAMVLDFGIAAILEGQRSDDYKSLTRASDIRGTPSYMAPEQIQDKRLTPQSDVYAWGLVFLECLLGRPAVTGGSPFEIAISQVSSERVPIPKDLLTDDLLPILERAVAKPLNVRYKHAAEVFEELDRCRIAQLTRGIEGDDASQTMPISASDANRLLDLQSKTPRPQLDQRTDGARINDAPTAIFDDAQVPAPQAPRPSTPAQKSEKIIVDDPTLNPDAAGGSSKTIWIIIIIALLFAILNVLAWHFLKA
ncbi:MAG: serine/threonine-protein kinase [Myxococcota bacterium]|jgi:serine/threonine protein kinase|nr:serine/threonine-protein kinase [Myxococcota bacterium]